MTSFSGVTIVLFCFVFVFMISLKLRPFLQWTFDVCKCPDSITFFFCVDVAFSDFLLFYNFLYHFPLSLCMESTSCVLSVRMVFSYLVARGVLTLACVNIERTNQSIIILRHI